MVNNVGEQTMQKDAWVYKDELKAGFKYNKQLTFSTHFPLAKFKRF
jgi:hypothetical protein